MFDHLKDKVSQYLGNHARLLQLNAVEKGATILGYITYGAIIMSLFLIVLVFLGAALGQWYAMLTGSAILGYLLSAVTFIVFLVVLVMMKSGIMKKFVNLFIEILTEDPKQSPAHKETPSTAVVDSIEDAQSLLAR